MTKFDKDIPEELPIVKQRRWNKKQCKKNKGLPHTMIKVATQSFKFLSNDGVHKKDVWEDWKCSFCGKKEMIWLK